MIKLYPEWKIPHSIGLVWPDIDMKQGYQYKGLCEFYEIFISRLNERLPDTVKIKIYIRPYSENIVPQFVKEMKRVDIVKHYYIQDIWIRDYAPFWGDDNGVVKAVKGKYYPYYGGKTYADRAKHDNELGIRIGGDEKCNRINYKDDLIILDGGNFVHNGAGIGICTNRVISDNENFFLEELNFALCDALGLEKLIIVPVEPGDDTGHIDGLARFVNEKTVLVSEYPYELEDRADMEEVEEYNNSQEFVDKIAGYLESQGFSVCRMSNILPKDESEGSVGSAVGNYLNFLRIGDFVFLPQYTDMDDENKKAIDDMVNTGINRENIVPVHGCDAIAKWGGVLNCITTHIYQ